MRTNLTSKLQLTDGSLTDQLTKRSRNPPLIKELLTVILTFTSLQVSLGNASVSHCFDIISGNNVSFQKHFFWYSIPPSSLWTPLLDTLTAASYIVRCVQVYRMHCSLQRSLQSTGWFLVTGSVVYRLVCTIQGGL